MHTHTASEHPNTLASVDATCAGSLALFSPSFGSCASPSFCLRVSHLCRTLAQELVSLAAQLGSVDNITALVIRLPGWRKYDNPSDTHLRQQAYTYNRGGRFRPLSML